jgi:hypothetical protein
MAVNKYIYRDKNYMCIKAIVLLSVLLIINCQRKNNSDYPAAEDKDIPETDAVTMNVNIPPDKKSPEILMNPFLLFYLRNHPSIKIDTSENVMTQRIWYKDFDKKEIDYSDAPRGTLEYSIYLFKNGMFGGIDSVTTNNGRLVWRYKAREINRDTDGLIISIDEYATGEGRFLRQHTYKKNNNVIVANDGLSSAGSVFAVLIEEEAKFLYFYNYKRYSETPDKPDMIIEFDNNDVIVTQYDYSSKKDYSYFYFTDGILMKREFIDRYTETYTVSSGIGEIIITEPDGTERERRMLERRINDAGLLEYEAVRSPSGTGYEYFFTKDTF